MYRTVPQILLLLLILSGCVTASVTKLSTDYYPPTLPEDVAIYLSEDEIPGEYDRIALIFTKGDYAATNESGQFKKAREKAAELGANGIIFNQMKEPKSGAKVANYVFGTPANRKSEMVAIFVHTEETNSE